MDEIIYNALKNGICVYFQAPLDKRDKTWYIEVYNHSATSRAKRAIDPKELSEELLRKELLRLIAEVASQPVLPKKGPKFWYHPESDSVVVTEDGSDPSAGCDQLDEITEERYEKILAEQTQPPSEEGGVDDLI